MPFMSRTSKDRKSTNASAQNVSSGFLGSALAKLRRQPDTAIDDLMKRIILPSLPVSDEEMARATHQDLGQKLARQDLWEDLAARMEYADDCRLATPGGESAALLLAFGARSDVVASVEDALLDGVAPGMAGIDALEDMLRDHRGSHHCALVVALSHFDIG